MEAAGEEEAEAFWVEAARGECESDKQWFHRRQFLLRNSAGRPAAVSADLDRLLAYSMVWANHVFMGCRYPPKVMEKVLYMAKNIKVIDAPIHTLRDDLVSKAKKRGLSNCTDGHAEHSPSKKKVPECQNLFSSSTKDIKDEFENKLDDLAKPDLVQVQQQNNTDTSKPCLNLSLQTSSSSNRTKDANEVSLKIDGATDLPLTNCTTKTFPLIESTAATLPLIESTAATLSLIGSEPASLPRIGSEPASLPRIGSEPASLPRIGSEPASLPRIGSEPASLPRIGSEPASLPRIGSEPASLPRIGSEPASLPRIGSEPASLPRIGSEPASLPRIGSEPASLPRIGSEPASLPRIGSEPASLPRIGSEPASLPRIGSEPASLPRIGSEPASLPRIGSEPASLPRIGSEPASLPQIGSKPASLLESAPTWIPLIESTPTLLPMMESVPTSLPLIGSTPMPLPQIETASKSLSSTESVDALPKIESITTLLPPVKATTISLPVTESAATFLPLIGSAAKSLPLFGSAALPIIETQAVPRVKPTVSSAPMKESTVAALSMIKSVTTSLARTESAANVLSQITSTTAPMHRVQTTATALPPVESASNYQPLQQMGTKHETVVHEMSRSVNPPVSVSKSTSRSNVNSVKTPRRLTADDAKQKQTFFNKLYKSVAWKLVSAGGFSPTVNHIEILKAAIESLKATLDVDFVPLKDLTDLPQNKNSQENIVCELRCNSVYLGTGCGRSKENAKAVAGREALKVFLKKKVVVTVCKRKYCGREIEDLVLLDEGSRPTNLPPALKIPQDLL